MQFFKKFIFFFFILFVTILNLNSAVYTSIQAGDWDDINTWDLAALPTAGDDVIINHTVLLNINTPIINDLTIGGAGTLRPKLLSGSNELNLDGNMIVNGTFEGVNTITNFAKLYFWGTTTLTVTGTFDPEVFQIESGAEVILAQSLGSGNGLSSNADFEIFGQLTCGSYIITTIVLSNFDIRSGGTLSTGVVSGVTATIAGAGTITYNNAANYEFTFGCTNTGFSNTTINDLTIDGAAITTCANTTVNGDFTVTSGSFVLSASTITLAGNPQSIVNNSTLTFFNLTVSGDYSSTSSFGINGSLSVTNSLDLNSASQVTFRGNGTSISNTGFLEFHDLIIDEDITTNANFDITGSLTLNAGDGLTASAGQITMTGAGETITGSGSLILFDLGVTGSVSSTFSFTINDDIDVAGSLTTTNGTITVAGNNKIILGGGTLSLYNLQVNNSYQLINTDITITNNMNLQSGTFDLNDNELTLAGTLTRNAGFIDASDNASTIEINNTGAFSIPVSSFISDQVGNLTLLRNGTVTLNNALDVDGTLFFSNAGLIFDIQGLRLNINGDITRFSGFIDATDNSSYIRWGGTSATTVSTLFLNDQVGNLEITLPDQLTYIDNIIADGVFTLNNGGNLFDISSNTLTINSDLVVTAGTIDLNDANEALSITSSATMTAFDIANFSLNTLNQAYFDKNLTISNNSTIVDLFYSSAGTSNFGNTTLTIQGDITLEGSGSLYMNTAGTTNFSLTSVFTNNSSGLMTLNDIGVSGTLDVDGDFTITGSLNVTNSMTSTSGTVTFDNIGTETITNSGTLEFNGLIIASGSTVNTSSNFTISGDWVMADATSVFTATTTSDITFGLDGLNIYAATNSNGTNTGLTFHDISFTSGYTTNFMGAYDFYVNGDINANNSYINFEDDSELILTNASGVTNFGIFSVDNLTFESTANFNWDCHTNIDGTVTVETGGQVYMFLNYFNNTNDGILVNQAPNSSNNLQFYEITVTNSIVTTDDSFRLNNWIDINATSTFLQTSGTFTKGSGAITNNGKLTINEFEIIGSPTTSSDILINGNFYNDGNSFIASAGTITFTNSNLYIQNTGTTQFYNVILANTVTNGTTNDSFTIAGDLTHENGSIFLATTPSIITFSDPSGVITTGASGALQFFSVNFTGDYVTSGAHSININGNFTVNNSFVGGTGSIIYLNGTSGVITNNGVLDFYTLIAGNNTFNIYTTSSNFEISGGLIVEDFGYLVATNGLITLEGTTNSIDTETNDESHLIFYDLAISASNFTSSSSYTVMHDYTVTSTSNANHSGGGVYFKGATTHSLSNNGTLEFFDLYVDNSANNSLVTSSDFIIAGDNFELEGTNSSFIASGGTVYFDGSSTTITNSSDDDSMIYNNIYANANSVTKVNANDNFEIIGDFYCNSNSDFIAYDTTEVTFNGSSQQTITVIDGANLQLRKFTLDNSSGLKLEGTIGLDEFQVYDNLRLEDGDLDLNVDNILTMVKPNAYLFETGGIIYNNNTDFNSNGHIYYQYDFTDKINSNSVLGLGIGFKQGTPSDVFGATTIKRYHANLLPAGSDAIQRYFSVESANDNLNARIVFNYFDTEIDVVNENTLTLLSSSDINENWNSRTANLLPTINRVAQTDTVDQFSGEDTFWTVAEPDLLTIDSLFDQIADTDNISNNRLIAGENYVVFGFSLSNDGQGDLENVKFQIENNSNNQLKNFKLYLSEDADFTTDFDNSQFGSTQATGIIEFEFEETYTLFANDQVYFFLTADVNDDVTIESDSVRIILQSSGITSSDGIVNINYIPSPYFRFQQRINVEFNPIGINESPLYSNENDLTIYGFKITPLGNEAGLKSFSLYFDGLIDEYFSGNFYIYKSLDNNFLSTDDNTLLSLTDQPIATNLNQLDFEFLNEQEIDISGNYFFVTVDSTSKNADDGSELLKIGIPTVSLYSTNAASVDIDTTYGNEYEFGTLEVEVSDYNLIPNSNVSIGVNKQSIFGFTLNSNGISKFESAIFQLVSDDLTPNSFQNLDFYVDENENLLPDENEFLNTAVVSGNFFTFSNFKVDQEFSGEKSYLVVAKPRNNLTAGSTFQVRILSSEYLSFQSPTIVLSGGPFTGNLNTLLAPSAPSQIEFINVIPSSIVSGDNVSFTVKILDSNGNPSPLTSSENVSFGKIGNITLSGTLARVMSKDYYFTTFEGFQVTTNVGDEDVVFSVNSDNFPTAYSDTTIVYKSRPTTNSGDLVLELGSPSISRVNINSWTLGDGDGRIIVASQSRTPETPTNGIIYNAITDFRNIGNVINSQLSSGSVVVYNGSSGSSQIELKNLKSNTKYYFRLYEYNLTGDYPVFYIPTDLATYTITTDPSEESFTDNTDTTNAAPILPDDTITGILDTEEEFDWFKINLTGDNTVINLCGRYKNAEIYFSNSGNLELLRNSVNTGNSCGVIILNDLTAGTYYLKVYGIEQETFPVEFTLKYKLLSDEIFSQTNCECP